MNRMKLLREAKGLTMKDAAKEIGLPYTTYVNYEKGDREPSSETLILIADYYCTSVDYLIGKTPIPVEAIPYAPTGKAPILGSIPAGAPNWTTGDIEGYEPVDVVDPQNYYWLRVKGDSMIGAGIMSGDLALIRMQNYADPGNIVACRVNGDEATLKRFKQQGNTVLLLPENPLYEPYVIPASDFDTGYAQILGVLVETKRKY